jgi:hypothetical protein
MSLCKVNFAGLSGSARAARRVLATFGGRRVAIRLEISPVVDHVSGSRRLHVNDLIA